MTPNQLRLKKLLHTSEFVPFNPTKEFSAEERARSVSSWEMGDRGFYKLSARLFGQKSINDCFFRGGKNNSVFVLYQKSSSSDDLFATSTMSDDPWGAKPFSCSDKDYDVFVRFLKKESKK